MGRFLQVLSSVSSRHWKAQQLNFSPLLLLGTVSFFPCVHFSPFKVKVLPTHDASKVRACGPGLNTTGVPASIPVEFAIDAKEAGRGLLAVEITVSAALYVSGSMPLKFICISWLLCYNGCSILLGPRGEAHEGQHQGQSRRNIPSFLFAREDRPPYNLTQVRGRWHTLFPLPYQGSAYRGCQQVQSHRYSLPAPIFFDDFSLLCCAFVWKMSRAYFAWYIWAKKVSNWPHQFLCKPGRVNHIVNLTLNAQKSCQDYGYSTPQSSISVKCLS